MKIAMNPLENPRLAALQLVTLYAWLSGFGAYMVLSALFHAWVTGQVVWWKLGLGLFFAVGGWYRNYQQVESVLWRWDALPAPEVEDSEEDS